jgi:hypothetical protein
MTDPAAIRLDIVRATLRAVYRVHAPTDTELRAVATELRVPYVEVWALANEVVERPRLRPGDAEEWLSSNRRERERSIATT